MSGGAWLPGWEDGCQLIIISTQEALKDRDLRPLPDTFPLSDPVKSGGSHPRALRTAHGRGSHGLTHRQAAVCWFSVGFSPHSGNCASVSASEIFLPSPSSPLTGPSNVKLLVIKTEPASLSQAFHAHPQVNIDCLGGICLNQLSLFGFC